AMNSPDARKQALTKLYRIQATFQANQNAALEKALQAAKADLGTKLEKSVDLEALDAKLTQSQELANDLSVKLQGREFEANSPAQIQRMYSEAMSNENINTAEHLTIVLIGGVGAFALAC